MTKAVSAVSAVPAVRTRLVATAARTGRRPGQRRGGGPRHRHGRAAGRRREDLSDRVGGGAGAAAQRAERRRTASATTTKAVLADVKRRDHLDSTRAVSPLRAADDALVVDTSDMSESEVIAHLAGAGRATQRSADVAMTRRADGTWADESDWELVDSEVGERRRSRRLGAAAGGRRRRAAERRQVDAGEPHPGPPRGGGAGRSRRHPGPGVLRRELGGPPVHRAGHRRLGARREGAAAAGRRAGVGGDAHRRRDHPRGRRGRRRHRTPTRRPPRSCSGPGKPVFLAANKVDTERGEADAAALWSLGLGEPHPVSAMHGRGVADLLDQVIEALPDGVGSRPQQPAVHGAWRWSASRTSARARC